MISISKTINSLLTSLTARQKDVIAGRFGLDKSGKSETLAAIGDRLKVTRERIRQIEHSALVLIGKEIKSNSFCGQVINSVKKLLKNSGGIMKKELLLEDLSSLVEGINENHLALILEASREFNFYPEDDNYRSFYYLSKSELRAALTFVESWINFLEDQKEKILAESYDTQLKEFVKRKNISSDQAKNFLSVSKKIGSNSYGDIGLNNWPEIMPLTTRARAYLILKKKSEPMHFVSIAKAINSAKLGPQIALAPTVHNELIKDNRFVLVGRGTYALREHGYEPGIARDVIKKVLQKNGPLNPEEIVAAVAKQRTFKANTIVINLQNKNLFERLSDGKYRVRES